MLQPVLPREKHSLKLLIKKCMEKCVCPTWHVAMLSVCFVFFCFFFFNNTWFKNISSSNERCHSYGNELFLRRKYYESVFAFCSFLFCLFVFFLSFKYLLEWPRFKDLNNALILLANQPEAIFILTVPIWLR